MATTPLFIGSSNIGFVRPTSALDASDGTGVLGSSIYNLVTAAANGTRVDRISITNSQATYASSAALVVRFYLTDTSGSNARLIDEILMPAITLAKTASTLGPANALYFPGGLFLKSGQFLRCSVSVFSNQQQVDIVAFGGDM